MFDHILIATDGSSHAQRAVDAGCQLAMKLTCKVSIVHVVGHGRLDPGLQQMAEAEHLVEPSRPDLIGLDELWGSLASTGNAELAQTNTYRAWQAIGQIILRQAVGTAKTAGLEVDGLLGDGDPGQCILRHATETGADLIVMGRRGMTNLQGLFLGSVSQKVCQRSEVACLTVV
jgi:nucleotide-binding universal stress UspA family protein